MTLEDLSSIEIAISPITNLERIVHVDGFYADFSTQQIKFYMTIYTKDVNGNLMTDSKSEVAPYQKITYASDAGLVNATTGEYVGLASEIEDHTGLVGEYTFFCLYAENPIEIYPILYSKVIQADTLGKLNRP